MKLKKLLKEAFTDKELKFILGPHKRRIESQLKGELGLYVQSLEDALLKSGASTKMSLKDLKDTVTQGMIPTAKAGDVKDVPDTLKPAGGVSPKGSPLPPPLPKDKEDIPSLSTLAKQATPGPSKEPMKEPSKEPEEPVKAPEKSMSPSPEQKPGSALEPGWDFDLGKMKKLQKTFGGMEKPKSKPKKGLEFDPNSPYLDPKVVKKMDKKGKLPSLKNLFGKK